MPKKILINTRTSGKVKEITIDGRPHLTTIMMPIRGDIAMNRIFYPDVDVTSSFNQLDLLPAPNGHPKVNGINTSAFHPVANNKHNIGGFLRNTRKKGRNVFCDFCLDLEIANQSEAGKELIQRMKDKKKIGVSTGLSISNVTNEAGTDDLGADYDRVGSGFTFDHVAILLNEAAAGEHAGTELILNESGEDIEIVNLVCNELSFDDIHSGLMNLIKPNDTENGFAWVRDIFPDSKTFTFVSSEGSERKLFKQSYAVDQNDSISLLNDKVEGVEKKEFVPKQDNILNNHKEVEIMDKAKLVLAIIGNSANHYTVADNDKLMAMNDSDLAAIITTNSMNEEKAKEYLATNGFDFAAFENFKANEAEFKAFNEANKAKLEKLRTDITALNADYTPEMLAGKCEAELTVINSMVSGTKVAKRIPEGNDNLQTNSADQGKAKIVYS